MAEKYFVASNSGGGFCSYYEGAFDTRKFSRIYAIKGGSGTGKATFMKDVAREAEKRGYSVRYIYCSSDAQSLDGIIINEPKIAVLDGTSPHIYEPKTVGAVDSIVNLGAFLDENLLRESRSIIEKVSLQKQRGFSAAYGYLRAYASICESIDILVKPAVNMEKLKKNVHRIVENVQTGQGNEKNLLVRSIGMRGLSSFDTYYERARIYYEIHDLFDSAHIFMGEIYSALKERRADMRISNNPIMPRRLDAVEIEKDGLAFEITNEGREGSRTINMRRFIEGSAASLIKADYRAAARVRDSALSLALAEFEKIKKHHFILEEIYGAAMDFSAKEEYTHHFCNKIFENN